VIPAIHRKLLRDLSRLKGQVLTIALVVAAGIASFVALQGNYGSLEHARDAFYERQRFAKVFARLERAPDSLRTSLEAIPGVERVQTRVVEQATLPLPQLPEPVRASLMALPDAEQEALNAIALREGRRPEPDHADECVLLHGFAEAHGFRPGDRLPAIINGKRRELRVVGTATSPEYVFALAPGSFAADPERFAVLWMNPEPLAAAFRMEGAFNDISLSLEPGASEPAVLEAVDASLVRFGGLGAYGRARQPSNQALENELFQLRSMSTILPGIFLMVSALLVHVVLSRLVQLQQGEIATLKAVGYSNAEVGFHFFELVLVVTLIGVTIGVLGGVWLGTEMVELYARYFKFPNLGFRFAPRDAVLGAAISLLAAMTGAFSAIRKVVRLPPAEAMRPPAPAQYRRSLIDRLGIGAIAGPSLQMIVRELERRPLRALMSAAAIAAATSLSLVAGWYWDGIETLVRTQFQVAMREDAAVSFVDPVPERAVRELAHLPGVLSAEGVRVVPVRFRTGHHRRDGVLWGYAETAEMRTLRDKFGLRVALPEDGVVLTDKLAEILGARVGDTVEIEIQEGQRDTRRLTVAGLVDESFGLQGHMRLEPLRRTLSEQPLVSVALLRIDPPARAELDARLKAMPFVAEVSRRAHLLERFEQQSASMIRTVSAIIALFAATITVGVVYNNARIALATRVRDLASLRVLGFTRGEISSVLLGELALEVLVALPFGFVFGRWLVAVLASTVDPETYRLPIVLTVRSYAFAATVTLLAALFTALIVRRRLDQLDLVAVLKTKE
jgi:putative ABC transport system permease protein